MIRPYRTSSKAFSQESLVEPGDKSLTTLRQRYNAALDDLGAEARQLLMEWPGRLKGITDETYSYEVRGKAVEGSNYIESLSHQQIPKDSTTALLGLG